MKKIIWFICLFFLLPCFIKADNGYEIISYDIDMKVNENNTFDIKETIVANFLVPKHGIIRTIPFKNEIVRNDGTKSKNKAALTNLSVNANYKLSKSNGLYNIKIGDADKTLTGEHTYVISYMYNIGKDPLKDKDELYFNLIGTSWDTNISNISFRIMMPKEFDEELLGFSIGQKGIVGYEDISYNVDDNVITGYYNKTLSPNEGLTIRLELPEGYFVDAKNPLASVMYLYFLIPIGCLFVSLLLWYLFGKDKKAVDTIEFYAPDNLNSLEIGYLYKGKAKPKYVTSLLIWLANKGYLKIIEYEGMNESKNIKHFQIEKIKEYDGNDENERLFFKALFSWGDKVTDLSLKNRFYETQNKILKNMNGKEHKSKAFVPQNIVAMLIMILALLVTIGTVITIPTLSYTGLTDLLISIFVILFYIPFYVVGCSLNHITFARVLLLFIFVHSLLLFSVLPITKAILEDNLFIIGSFEGIICTILIIILLRHMSRRNDYGIEMLGRIKGFKHFLETAEKENLEAIVNENPNYFYDILPYTYVLGVSKKWISKFETINIKEPQWYNGTSTFDIFTFNDSINRSLNAMHYSLSPKSSSSSSSSRSGSSGGGSSGGGSGGGGGSSW